MRERGLGRGRAEPVTLPCGVRGRKRGEGTRDGRGRAEPVTLPCDVRAAMLPVACFACGVYARAIVSYHIAKNERESSRLRICDSLL